MIEYRLMYLLTQPTQDGEVNLPTFHIIKVIHIMYFSFTTPPLLRHIYYPVICCFAFILFILFLFTEQKIQYFQEYLEQS